MKKKFLLASLFALGLLSAPVFFASCDDDADNTKKEQIDDDDDDEDGQEAFVCVEQILDGCMDIANEVGESKIGDPINLWESGDHTKALYAVESWYSYHSREDYRNNIYSVRNAYFGSRDGKVAANSLASVIAANNADLDAQVKAAISEAADAIWAIPDPFRNNIACAEAKTAQEKCATLNETLKTLKSYIEKSTAINKNSVLDPIIKSYVENVVKPTYKDLMEGNSNLFDKVAAFRANPTDENFKAVSLAWLDARQPWETSEAFLFGPVDAEGLDPNMDSWPLDQDNIVEILNSGKFDNLDWADGDDDDAIEAKQGIRGFHTLEFLTFRNGVARTTSDKAASDDAADIVYNAQNAASWANYMYQVAYLLKKDATDLYNYWTVSYKNGKSFADMFLSHDF